MVERVIAACDGAAKGNPGPAAWAFVVADSTGTPQRWQAGPLGHSTNNIGELTALEQLLEATDPAAALEVRLDSTYTRDAVTKWLTAWKRNGWKTAGGKPVANRELIQRIDGLLTGRDVTFVYVPAHQVDGDPLNAIADAAASDAARTQEAAGGTGADLPVPAPSRTAPARAARRSGGAGGGAAASKSAGAGAAPASGRTRTIAARFPGTCPCGRSYPKGDPITKVGKGWGHPECATAASASAASAPGSQPGSDV
ncbi:ribonuclease H family protein [Streptacidiphilus sp. PAMC 29251]